MKSRSRIPLEQVNGLMSEPFLETAAAPHEVEAGASTRRMMLDVLIGLAPVVAAALWFFRGPALLQIVVCLVTALATEAFLCRLRGRPISVTDGSATITALILALSLPPRLPLYAAIAGAFVAIAVGKMVFGGLGQNLFNPAMVGRAFLMVCFPAAMTAWAEPLTVHATTAATPLAAAKFGGQPSEIFDMAIGRICGSLGETSAVAIVLGGLWPLLRRAGDWRLTAGMLLPIAIGGWLDGWRRGPEGLGLSGHLLAGGALLGAFFIVTDPVTSPLSRTGRWAFGLTVGGLTMVIRLFAGYPEGVMFSVLIANAITPLLNRWTVPRPVGGPVPTAKDS